MLGAIIGGVLGGLCLLCIVIAIVVVLIHKRRDSADAEPNSTPVHHRPEEFLNVARSSEYGVVSAAVRSQEYGGMPNAPSQVQPDVVYQSFADNPAPIVYDTLA